MCLALILFALGPMLLLVPAGTMILTAATAPLLVPPAIIAANRVLLAALLHI